MRVVVLTSQGSVELENPMILKPCFLPNRLDLTHTVYFEVVGIACKMISLNCSLLKVSGSPWVLS